MGADTQMGVGVYRTSLVYALQNWLSESPDQAARKPGSNPGILGVAMGLMAVFIVCLFSLSPIPTSSNFPFLNLSLFFFFFKSSQEASNPLVNQIKIFNDDDDDDWACGGRKVL